MALEREKNKLVIEKCQSLLTALLKDDDNKYCVDCDAKSPRWASWNIGIFLCIRCAGIHRNLGVHISRVKSVNLDSWTPQQVACIQQMGNSRARAVYEANLQDNFRRPQTDSSLEQFIRAKYEAKKYIAREWVQPPLPNPTWDVELEKQLRKKKDKKSVPGVVEFPAQVKNNSIKSSGVSPKPLPKAPGGRNNSPNTAQLKRLPTTETASTTSKGSQNEQKQSESIKDLLGLDCPAPISMTNGTATSDQSDIFGDFLAAPPMANNSSVEVTQTVDTKATKDEESSFFNQKLPDASSEKMSKDSILALYSKTSPQPPIMGGNPGGMMMGGRMPMVSSGVPASHGMMIPQRPITAANQTQNRMFFQQSMGTTSMPGMQHQNVSQGTAPMGMFPGLPGGVQLSAANPFSQLPMSNLSLGGISASNSQVVNPLVMGSMSNPMGNMNGLNPSQSTSLSKNMWQ